MRRLLSALTTLLALSACDSDTDPVVPTDDAVTVDTASPPADTAPAVDTFQIPVEPRDFKNGATGRIVHVVDGDTVHVFVGETFPKSYAVRLQGLGAPECVKKQVPIEDGSWQSTCSADDEFYGLASCEGAKSIAQGQRVKITCDGVANGAWCPQDDFDRYLAYLQLENGKDFATEMAWHGWAFSYTSFSSSKRAAICAAEYDARKNKRGMWSTGTVAQVLAKMSTQTQGWYKSHDSKCDAALGR